MGNREEQFWHILYIDDDEEDFLLIRRMLAEAYGRKIELDWAPSYETGRAQLASDLYDAVLVDYDLGGQSGIELIRENSKTYPAPLILFTGRGTREVDLEAMTAGATLYLTKDEVNSLLLERSIRYAIELKQKTNALLVSNESLERELVERERAEAAAAADLADTLLLRSLSERLVTEGDIQVFYREILRAAIGLTHADGGTVQLIEDATQELRLLTSVGFDPGMSEHFSRVSPGSNTSCGMALARGERACIDFDVPESEDRDGSLGMHVEAGYLSAQSTPLMTRSGRLLGMLSTHWREKRRLTEREQRFLDLLARQAADLIEVWQSQEALRQSEARLAVEIADLERLQQISSQLMQEENINALFEHLLEAAMAVMHSDMGSLQLYDAGTHELHLLAWKGFHPASAQFWERVHTDSSSACSVAMGRLQRVFVPDVEAADFMAGTEDLVYSRLSGIVAVQTTPLLSRAGRLVGMISTHWREQIQPAERELRLLDVLGREAADLIERKQAEAKQKQARDAQQASEEKYRTLFNSIDEGFCIIEILFDEEDRPVDYRFLEVNAEFERQTGIHEAVGKRMLEEVPKHEMYWVEIYGEIAKTGEARRFENPADALGRYYEVYAFPIGQPEDHKVAVLFKDIAKRKQLEAELQESERRFRAMADETPVCIWVMDPVGRIEFVNRAYQEYFGVTGEQVRAEGWEQLIHPEDREAFMKVFRQCLRERKPLRAQGRVRRKDGEWRWVDSQGEPRFSGSGDFLGMAGNSLDISEQKQAEQDQQCHTEELERLNQALRDFTAIASHDLQEPLRKVQFFGPMLEKELDGGLSEAGKDYLARMTSAAGRMSSMLKSLGDYSQVTSHGEQFTRLDLQKVVGEVVSDLEVCLLESGGRVETGPLPTIQGDPVQIRQLFQNLIGNGLKFHRPGIPPQVTVSGRIKAKKQVEVTVSDNGIGFEMKEAGRLFEPFVRLNSKSEHEGTGIGLAICKKIVERHHGTISASGVPGEGSTFRIILPV